MNEITQAAGHLSRQDDRYLFLFILILLLVFGWAVLKHLTSQNASLVAKLEKEQQASRETNERLILALDHNTNVVIKNSSVMEQTSEELAKCRATCAYRE